MGKRDNENLDNTQQQENAADQESVKNQATSKKKKSKFKKNALFAAAVSLTGISTAVIAPLSGLSAAAVAGAKIAYDAVFSRYDRPDYALKAGVCCFSRANQSLKRELRSFDSDGIRLQGYYYRAKAPKGLTVVCHGLHSGADDYLPIIEFMVASGYSVFAFDYKGTYDSDGDSTVGMCESLVDLDHALDYLESTSEFDALPITLIGHSWGGYAVASVLPLHPRVAACAAIAAPNNGYTLILEKGDEYGGQLATKGIPEVFFNVYQKILFGKYTKFDAVKGINGTHIPVLIAHGESDNVINVERQAIYAHKDELREDNVQYYYATGAQGGHSTIWHSKASAEYYSILKPEIKSVKKDKTMSYEQKVEFFNGIDHRLYSEINEELFGKIVEMFDSVCAS